MKFGMKLTLQSHTLKIWNPYRKIFSLQYFSGLVSFGSLNFYWNLGRNKSFSVSLKDKFCYKLQKLGLSVLNWVKTVLPHQSWNWTKLHSNLLIGNEGFLNKTICKDHLPYSRVDKCPGSNSFMFFSSLGDHSNIT